MEKIWTVWGATGEYSDHVEWPVAAYRSESSARKHVERASLHDRGIAAVMEENYEVFVRPPNPYDQNQPDHLEFNSNPFQYYIVEFQLKDRFEPVENE